MKAKSKSADRSRRKSIAKPATRSLTPAERNFAESRYAEAIRAQKAAVQAVRLWEETLQMLTGGDESLGLNTKTWEIVPAPPKPAIPSAKEEG